MNVGMRINGRWCESEVLADESILDVLRRDHGLLSVRETCGVGVCGACTVLLDGEPVAGCLLLAPLADGREITTVEGLPDDHRLLRSFTDAHAFQCGYCTPGMVLTAAWLLEERPRPSEAEVREAMSGNLCRCGSYLKIVDAVMRAVGD